MKYPTLYILLIGTSLCGGCTARAEPDEPAVSGQSAGRPAESVIQESDLVGIGVVPDEFASSAKKALEENWIVYTFEGSLGVTGFRVLSKYEAQAIAALQADAKRHSYQLTLAK